MKNIDNNSIIFPFEHHHIGICDQLWFGRSCVMDKFTMLFEWIKNNINTLFFVNENVLYKFIDSQNINIKCMDIQYILRRDSLLGVPNHVLSEEYATNRTLPWILTCPEKKEIHYQSYISSKNESANNIFFLTKELYVEIQCKILNCVRNKFLHVSEQNYYNGITGGNTFTHFIIKPYNAFLVNLIVNNPTLSHGTIMCLTVNNNKIICTSNIHDSNSQFMLLTQDKRICFAQNQPVDKLTAFPDSLGVNCGKFFIMDKNNNVFANGDKQNPECQWNILYG
jgi:hypothetical protein